MLMHRTTDGMSQSHHHLPRLKPLI